MFQDIEYLLIHGEISPIKKITEWSKHIDNNPSDWNAYLERSNLLFGRVDDKSIQEAIGDYSNTTQLIPIPLDPTCTSPCLLSAKTIRAYDHVIEL